MSLREARFFKQRTQWQIALATGISQSKLSQFECGYRTPSDSEKIAIASALGCEVKDLFPK